MNAILQAEILMPPKQPLHIRGSEILTALINEVVAVEYQPIKATQSLDTIGHEALSRFFVQNRALPPDRVFAALHDNPLLFHYAELRWKKLQIEKAPTQGLLFVNLDPHAWLHGMECDAQDSYLELFKPHAHRLVVEVIENLHLSDVEQAENLSLAFKSAGIPLALDDVSCTQGIVSLASLMDAQYMKFDRGWLQNPTHTLEKDKRFALLEYALNLARELNLTTILEGVETKEHLALARQYKFDCVQGFLFKNDFIKYTEKPI